MTGRHQTDDGGTAEGGTSTPQSTILGDVKKERRSASAQRPRLVPVRLQTRRDGDTGWTDRGLAYVPLPAVDGGARTLLYDAITYVVEDVFDDGQTPTIWARTQRPRPNRPRST